MSRSRRCHGRLWQSFRRTSSECPGRSRGASSFPSDFNNDFSVSFTEKQQHEGDLAYNYRREKAFVWRPEQEGGGERTEAQFSATCGTDPATYRRDRPA